MNLEKNVDQRQFFHIPEDVVGKSFSIPIDKKQFDDASWNTFLELLPSEFIVLFRYSQDLEEQASSIILDELESRNEDPIWSSNLDDSPNNRWQLAIERIETEQKLDQIMSEMQEILDGPNIFKKSHIVSVIERKMELDMKIQELDEGILRLEKEYSDKAKKYHDPLNRRSFEMNFANFSKEQLIAQVLSEQKVDMFVRVKGDSDFSIMNKIGGCDAYIEDERGVDYSYGTLDDISLLDPVSDERLKNVPLEKIEIMSIQHLSMDNYFMSIPRKNVLEAILELSRHIPLSNTNPLGGIEISWEFDEEVKPENNESLKDVIEMLQKGEDLILQD